MAKVRHLLALDKPIPFGKFKGEKVVDLCKRNEGFTYLAWCAKNDICDFEAELEKALVKWVKGNPEKYASIRVTAKGVPEQYVPSYLLNAKSETSVPVAATVKAISTQRQAQWGSW